jgi:hypothetical protein
MVAVDSTIHSVKVYRSGASVTRRFTLEATGDGALPDEVEVRPLPLALVDATARVRVVSTDADGADVLASNVRVGLTPREEREAPPSPDVDALKAAKRELAALQLTDRLARAELGSLARVFVPDRPEGEEGKPPPPSPLAARAALEQLAWDASTERKRETRELREKLREARRKVGELQARVDEATNARQLKPGELAKTVLARLVHDGPRAKRAELELEYFVPGARWAPAYQCHIERDGSAAHVQLRALIAQRTGEDWRGVRVELSTASPLTFTELPEMSSIRIGRAQPPPSARPGFRPPPQGGSALFADYDRGQQHVVGLLPREPPWQPPRLAALNPVDLDGASPPPPPPAARAPAPMPAQAMAPRVGGARSRSRRHSDEITAEGEAVKVAEAEMMDFVEEAPEEAMLDEPLSMDDEEDSLFEADEFEATTDLVERSALRAAPAKKRARPGPPRAALEAVSFTQLILGASDDRAWRGRLRPIEAKDTYLELLSRGGVEVGFDVMTVVRGAESEAYAIGSMRLPEGAVDVGRVSGSFDFSYEADGSIDVPSDGGFHSVALGTRECEATLRYVVVPRLDSNVYREANLVNPIDAPLLAGPTEIYVGGEYVLTTRLPTVAPSGEFRLGLGVEQAIKCARNTRFSERRSGEKVVAMTELEHSIDVDLVNNLGRDVFVEVRERIPQPAGDAEVVVEEGAVEPAWEEYDQEERGHPLEGGRRWRVTVAPSTEKKLSAQYVVKIYANNELVGGNRREA